MAAVVILLQSGIGDDLMAIPLLRACLDALRPDDRLLILACEPLHKTLIAAAIGADPRVEIRCVGHIWIGPKRGLVELALQLRRLRPKALLLPQSTNRARMTVFAGVVNARKTAAPASRLNTLVFGTTVAKREEHKVSEYLRFGATAGLITGAERRPTIELAVPKAASEEARRVLGAVGTAERWIGFAPGSGTLETHKRWPIEHWRSLAEMILRRGPEFRVAVIGAPSERPLLDAIGRDIPGGAGRVVQVAAPDVMVTAGVLRHCDCVVSACSGTLHFAAAVGVPVVGLYGPTNPGFTGPFTDRARIVRLGLACSPCFRLGFSGGCGQPLCMTMIKPDLVDEHVILALQGEFTAPLPWFATTDAVRPTTDLA